VAAPYYPESLWNEILPGLFQGGTEEADELGGFLSSAPHGLKAWQAEEYIAETRIRAQDFDTVITAFAHSNPCGIGVKELRYAFMDGNMSDFKPEQDLVWLVREAHTDWRAGKKVLIRCQAGINRSGLIMALVLIKEGYSPEDAIKLIREKRCESALTNEKFANWLQEFADVDFWRSI